MSWLDATLDSMFGPLVTTFIISMIPVVELRGAIPFGVAAGLSPLTALVTAIVGNFVPVPILILLTRQVFDRLRQFPILRSRIDWLEQRAHLKGEAVRKYRLLGLTILVGIPLPGTGAWTGALVASMLNIRLMQALPAIFLGLLIAGGITTAVTCGVFRMF